jgi:hypothetical protein
MSGEIRTRSSSTMVSPAARNFEPSTRSLTKRHFVIKWHRTSAFLAQSLDSRSRDDWQPMVVELFVPPVMATSFDYRALCPAPVE